MSAINPYSGDIRGGSKIGPPLDADALLWVAAVVTAGGTVSAARQALVSNFIAAEKHAGCWTLTDDYWLLWAENATQALVSLKQLRTATPVNSPTFTANSGYAGNGTSSYINTGFIPATHGVALTVGSAHLAAYELTNVGSAGVTAGCQNSTTESLRFVSRTAVDGYQIAAVSDIGGSGSGVTDSRGLTSVQRDDSSATVFTIFKNGALATTPTRTKAANLPGVALFILANNNNGVAANFRAATTGFTCAGGAVSSSQRYARYQNVLALGKAVGAI